MNPRCRGRNPSDLSPSSTCTSERPPHGPARAPTYVLKKAPTRECHALSTHTTTSTRKEKEEGRREIDPVGHTIMPAVMHRLKSSAPSKRRPAIINRSHTALMCLFILSSHGMMALALQTAAAPRQTMTRVNAPHVHTLPVPEAALARAHDIFEDALMPHLVNGLIEKLNRQLVPCAELDTQHGKFFVMRGGSSTNEGTPLLDGSNGRLAPCAHVAPLPPLFLTHACIFYSGAGSTS